jgi:hypothetical protein
MVPMVELPPPAGAEEEVLELEVLVVVGLFEPPAEPATLGGVELPQAASPMEQAANAASDQRRRRDMGSRPFFAGGVIRFATGGSGSRRGSGGQ